MNPFDIYDYLNKKNMFRNIDDENFIIFSNIFADKLYEYGFDKLLEDYNNGLTSNEKDWFNLKKKQIDIDWINAQSTVGTNIIKRNMPHIYEVSNYKGYSIKKLWIKENILKAIIVNRKSHPTPYVSEIIRQIGFICSSSKVTLYRPLLTKRIVETFNSKNVLDVCVGWGGRMLGSSCIDGVKYTGIEPFKKTYKGLKNIKKELNLGNVILYNDTAENILPKLKKEYDLALTSPPYYNLEIYSEDKNQSHKYGSYEEWIDNFLRPVIFGVLDKLLDHGKSCWSVKNFKTDKKYNLYDDVVKLHNERGWIKIDREFYVGNCTRPGLNMNKGKESTFVFVKHDQYTNQTLPY